MPRPHTKALLLSESQKERAALDELLEPLTPVQMTEPGILGEWSVKDVLAHLYEWEQMVLGWLAATERGKTSPRRRTPAVSPCCGGPGPAGRIPSRNTGPAVTTDRAAFRDGTT